MSPSTGPAARVGLKARSTMIPSTGTASAISRIFCCAEAGGNAKPPIR